MKNSQTFLVFVILVSMSVKCALCFEMTLLHVNDIHVKIEETNKYSSTCKPRDKEAGQCYGGVARLSQAVKEIKGREKNVLWLNGGDFYQGTVWYTQFKWRVVSLFNNMLNFDAMTLGNHEFDDKIAGLEPFLRNQSCPVVVTNMNVSLVPALAGLTVPSIKVEIGDKVVGIVGYITPETKDISNPEEVIFTDEIEALKTEVKKLHDEGIDIIVALGHSGYEKDKEVAASVPHLDVVVGAHSHSFLFSSENPSVEKILGPYPTIIENPGGHKTLVVQAYAYTKYLGHMKLTFSDSGDLVSWRGAPILLNSKYPEDPAVVAEVAPWRAKLDVLSKTVIGSAETLLLESRDGESNIGNFVTDAMVNSWKGKRMPNGGKISVGLCNSGGIRAAIEAGNITLEDLMTTFPFSNTFDAISIKGRHLREALEHSVSKFTHEGENLGGGGFMQVSGARLVYDVTREVGNRLVSAEVRCGDCDEDTLEPLEDDKVYNVVTSNYVLGGGDGYTMLEENMQSRVIGDLDTDVIKEVLESSSPVSAEIEGRITIIKTGSENKAECGRVTAGLLTMALIHLSFVLVMS